MGSKTNPEEYIGKTYGRLTVRSLNNVKPNMVKGKKYGYRYYMNCDCSCGNTAVVCHLDFLTGHTKSCGCIARENIIKQNYIHGHTAGGHLTPEWSSWSAMISRCYDSTSTAYPRYGAKGISVCDRWRGKTGFINFYKDMGDKPKRSYTIDRIDGTKNYFPDNCRWATRLTQNNNQRSNRKVEWEGSIYNISQLMRKLGIYTKSGVYYTRLDRGWSIEDTFNTPRHTHIK